MPPSHSISGGSADTVLVTCMLVRYTRCDASSNRAASCLGAERLDDAVAGERFGGDVREHLELFLRAPASPADALPEPTSG